MSQCDSQILVLLYLIPSLADSLSQSDNSEVTPPIYIASNISYQNNKVQLEIFKLLKEICTDLNSTRT